MPGSPRRQRHVLLGEQVEHEARDGHPAQAGADAVGQVGGALPGRLLGQLARRHDRARARRARAAWPRWAPASPTAGRLSVGAGIPPAGGSALRARQPTRNRRATTGRRQQRVRVIGRLRLGSRRARLYTRRLSCQRPTTAASSARAAPTDVVLCGNPPRMPRVSILEIAICHRAAKVMVVSSSANNEVPRTPGSLSPGDHFGRYQLLERIGKGGMAEVFRAVAQRRAGVRAHVRRQAHPARQVRFAEVRADVLRGGAHLGAAASPEHRAGLRLRSHRRRVLHGDGAPRRQGSLVGHARVARATGRGAAVGGGVRGARVGARASSRAHPGAARRDGGRGGPPRRHAVQHHVAQGGRA